MPALAANPAEPGHLLAGASYNQGTYFTSRGGLYRSADFGVSWSPITLTFPISAPHQIVFDPAYPTNVYAGTASSWGSWILHSADGGETWQQIGTEYPQLKFPGALAVEPVYPHRIIVHGMDQNLYMSFNQGQTWQQVIPQGELGINVGQFLYTPEDPPILYAATPTGLSRSTDGGYTWSRAAGALGYANVVSLDAEPADGRIILYVGITGGEVGISVYSQLAGHPQFIKAGVYRLTTLLSPPQLFLPLVIR